MEDDDAKRSFNYNEKEKSLLLDLFDNYKNVLECKKTDKVTSKDKEKAWKKIEKEFNAETVAQCRRNAASLRTCYENIKKRAKKACGDEKVQVFLTGGGIKSSKITEQQARVVAMIPEQFVPDENPYDCDGMYA